MIAWLFRDDSEASDRVENELRRRKVEYRTIWNDDTARPLPSLEVGTLYLEGAANIELYFLNSETFVPTLERELALSTPVAMSFSGRRQRRAKGSVNPQGTNPRSR